jgi:hypothetical protein
LDGDPESLTPQDISANPEAGAELLGQLQGMSLYSNDNSPWHQTNVTFYDLKSAQIFLESLRESLGEAVFKNSKVVFEELLLGVDFKALPEFKNVYSPWNAPNPHIITKAYNIPRDGSLRVNPSLSSLSQNIKEVLLNLQLYNNSNVLLSWVIEHPDRELQLLREISGADGNTENISSTDMQSSIFQNKLKQLEGYRLYTNDPGKDATQADLNSAYALLSTLAGRYDLAHSDVMLSEKILPDNERRGIQGAQIVLNEAEDFAELSNFGL